MTEESLVSTDVDHDRDGKQFGRIQVPVSTNSSGWAQYFIPVVNVRNGDGPTAVLFGGNHGDEFEGPVALMKLARELDPQSIRGRVIMVPMLNRPAVTAGTRLSPIDGANMNRAFPGSCHDSFTGMIAHYVSTKILDQADLVVDVHSGGVSNHFLPCVNMHRVEDDDQMKRMLAAGKSWGAPMVFIYRDVAGEGLLPSYAEKLGKVTLGTEVGGRAQFGVKMLQITETGLRNVLHWLGILAEPATAPPAVEPQVVASDDTRDYVMSPVSGIFEPFCELGDDVKIAQVLGQVHDLEMISRPPVPVRAETAGFVIARRAIPLTAQGEMVAAIARPFEL
jgi:N-alpha-acetyl-L-2,4-diaminobutyrate deacetylase